MIRAAAVGAVVALAALYWFVVRDPYAGRTLYVHRAAPAFTLLYRRPGLQRTPGALLRLAGRRGTVTVTALALPDYEGDVTGVLPVVAEDRIRALAARLPHFTLTTDARDLVHDAPAYEIAFRSARGSGSDLLVVPSLHARSGVVVSVRQRRAAPALTAAQQSFAFGSRRP